MFVQYFTLLVHVPPVDIIFQYNDSILFILIPMNHSQAIRHQKRNFLCQSFVSCALNIQALNLKGSVKVCQFGSIHELFSFQTLSKCPQF